MEVHTPESSQTHEKNLSTFYDTKNSGLVELAMKYVTEIMN